MIALPNPFMNSADLPALAESGAAQPTAPCAAPVIAARTDVLQTVAATVSAGDDISDINEIFWFVRNKLQDYPRFVLDEAAFMGELEEPPLFLQRRA